MARISQAQRERTFNHLVDTLRTNGWTVEVTHEDELHSVFATCDTDAWYKTPIYLSFAYNSRGFLSGRISSPANTARRRIARRLYDWNEVARTIHIYSPIQ